MGRDMGLYVYVQLIHFVIKQKLTNHCKALYSNKYVKKKEGRKDRKIERKERKKEANVYFLKKG